MAKTKKHCPSYGPDRMMTELTKSIQLRIEVCLLCLEFGLGVYLFISTSQILKKGEYTIKGSHIGSFHSDLFTSSIFGAPFMVNLAKSNIAERWLELIATCKTF